MGPRALSGSFASWAMRAAEKVLYEEAWVRSATWMHRWGYGTELGEEYCNRTATGMIRGDTR
jgi:hypothetical protein